MVANRRGLAKVILKFFGIARAGRAGMLASAGYLDRAEARRRAAALGESPWTAGSQPGCAVVRVLGGRSARLQDVPFNRVSVSGRFRGRSSSSWMRAEPSTMSSYSRRIDENL